MWFIGFIGYCLEIVLGCSPPRQPSFPTAASPAPRLHFILFGTLIIFEAVTSRAVWFSMFMAPPTLTRTCVGCHDLPRRFVDISIHAFESYIIKLLANPVTYCGRDGISCTTSYHYSNTKFETSRYAKLPVEISLVLAQSRFSCIDNMVGYTTGHASCPNMW